ncbi:MAG TPA: helix-turn-helix transcriptional regulator [Dongiaceae bacterium]
MLQHVDVWRGIDRLAAKYGLSASGLARRAGLDPTAFNPSKRITREGRPRWPSTESLSKVLAVTGESFSGFVALTGAPGSSLEQQPAGNRITAKSGTPAATGRTLPIVALSRVADGDCFDSQGHPQGSAWGRISPNVATDNDSYAIEINGRDFDPVYRDGDVIVVSPAAEIRRGDRVLVGTAGAGVQIRRLGRRDTDGVYVEPLTDDDGTTSSMSQFVAADQVQWVARIVWASQ